MSARAVAEDEAVTRERAAALDQLAEIAEAAEAQRVEYEAARRELDETARRLAARILAAEGGMRDARRRFIQVLGTIAPGCTRLTYMSSRSPEVRSRLQSELDEAMEQMRERGVRLGVVLADWLGGGCTVVDVNWQPEQLEYGEAVQLATRIAAERRRRL